MELTHANLCGLAVRWLKRPHSAGGHACTLAVSECRSGYAGEAPDAIGFRANWNNGSVVVEVKVSRSDFLADRRKPHRKAGAGMGTWRYYMAPAGLLTPDDLPERWGLLEVNARGHIMPVAGPAAARSRIGDYLDAWRHEPDHDAERDLLVLLLNRVDDPETVNLRLREANRHNQYLLRQLEKEREANRQLAAKLWASQSGAALAARGGGAS
jgi:hypothetical protein